MECSERNGRVSQFIGTMGTGETTEIESGRFALLKRLSRTNSASRRLALSFNHGFSESNADLSSSMSPISSEMRFDVGDKTKDIANISCGLVRIRQDQI